MTAVVVPIGLNGLMRSPAPAPADASDTSDTSDTAIDHYAELLSAMSLGPLGHPLLDLEGGLRFEWEHTDRDGRHWDLRAVIEASGGLYLVALGPTAAHDDELYLEHFDAAVLIRFAASGVIPTT